MTPDNLAQMAATCFPNAAANWTARDFDRHLNAPGQITEVSPEGFIIGRASADEAEIYSVGVLPECRQNGVGKRLLSAFVDRAKSLGAVSVFLEVSTANAIARTFYDNEGFEEVGRRPRYYDQPAGDAIDAVILKKSV